MKKLLFLILLLPLSITAQYAVADFIVINQGMEKDYEKLELAWSILRENQIATGDSAVYFVDNEKILIKGNVTLEREDSIMLGDELSIDLKTSSSKLISKNNEKVKAKYNTEK